MLRDQDCFSCEMLPDKRLRYPARGWVPVARTYNPSYSGSKDHEDCGSKPAWANSSQDPISKKLYTKRAGGVAQGEGPEFKPP
jgi:hypothetical protein